MNSGQATHTMNKLLGLMATDQSPEVSEVLQPEQADVRSGVKRERAVSGIRLQAGTGCKRERAVSANGP